MRENKVVYGLIGYGGMGRWHTEILSNVPEAVIGGIYDIKEEKREEAKAKGFSVYETEEAMLADSDIDVVLIATPNDCHKPIAIRAMHAGKNVISEKPVTLSSADLLEMEKVAKETGKLFTVHQNRRWDDDFLIIKKLVEEQKLGHVFGSRAVSMVQEESLGTGEKKRSMGAEWSWTGVYTCWIRFYICTEIERSRRYTRHLPISPTRKWTMGSLLF